MSFPSESDMMSIELRNSDLIYVNLMADAFKVTAKYPIYRQVGTELNREILAEHVYT